MVYTQVKPCCKNKAKSGVSCKNIQVNKDAALNSEQITISELVDNKPCLTSDNCCKKEGKSPWWKFWSKKSTKTGCNASGATETVGKNGVSNKIKGSFFVPVYTDDSTGCYSY